MKFEKVSVTDRIWRGSQPLTATDYQVLQNFGIRFILDLESGSALFGDGHPLEENLKAATYGIQVFNHPLGGILPPTKKELNDALGILLNFQPIFVHCKEGVDRTGMVIAWFRMKQQSWTKDKAVANMLERGMHFWYYWWTFFL